MKRKLRSLKVGTEIVLQWFVPIIMLQEHAGKVTFSFSPSNWEKSTPGVGVEHSMRSPGIREASAGPAGEPRLSCAMAAGQEKYPKP